MFRDSTQSILMPVRASTIIASFVVALLLNFLPWRDLRVVPDFVALVLVFWCVRQPRLVGLGVGWTLGLLTDAGNGVLLGQHALAYSLLAFLAVWLSRRILWFGVGLQALHVAGDTARRAGGVAPRARRRGHPGAGLADHRRAAHRRGAVAGGHWFLLYRQRRTEREQAI